MARVTIPDRVCPHCGGTEWYSSTNKNGYTGYSCIKKKRENAIKWLSIPENRARFIGLVSKYNKTTKGKRMRAKYTKKRIENLTDSYIIEAITAMAYYEKVKLDRKSITKEQIERYRQSILAQRQLKQLKTQVQ